MRDICLLCGNDVAKRTHKLCSECYEVDEKRKGKPNFARYDKCASSQLTNAETRIRTGASNPYLRETWDGPRVAEGSPEEWEERRNDLYEVFRNEH